MISDYIKRLRSRFFRDKGQRKPKPLIQNRHAYKVVKTARSKVMPDVRQLRHVGRILSTKERRILQMSVVVFAVSVLWAGGVFTSQYRERVPAAGGRYTEAVVGTPDAINPLFASINEVDKDLVQLIYSGLMRYNKDQQLIPDLAAGYVISEDKKIYTFTLREDVFWHDGEPFTADDVVFTFEQIQTPEVNSPLLFSFQGVQVTALDDYTVQFQLQEPFQPFLASLTVGVLPSHIWQQFPPEQMRLAKPNLRPIGTGPFQFDRLAKDDTGFIFQYDLRRFDGYYDQKPYIEEFIFQFFGEYEGDLGAIQALRQNKVDGLHYVPSHLRDRVNRKHIVTHTLQLPQYTALFFNQKRQVALENKNLRQALAYAIDKDRIIRESLDNDGQVIEGPILPGFPGYDSEIEKIPYDLDQANTLLDESWKRVTASEYRDQRMSALLAQYGVSSSTISSSTPSTSTEEVLASIEQQLSQELSQTQLFYRQNDDGEILTLDLVTADTQEYQQAAKLIAGFWQDLGIRTNISYIQPRNLSRDILRERKYDVLLYGVIVGSDPDQYPFWHSSQASYPGLNLSQYINRNIDELLVKAREATDDATINDVYTQFQTKILEDQPAIFLYTPIYRYATTDDVHGFDVSRIFYPSDRFTNVTEWYLKTKGDWSFSHKK